MQLIFDDYLQVYIWVNELDHYDELSPHFDYKEDAIAWRTFITDIILKEQNANS